MTHQENLDRCVAAFRAGEAGGDFLPVYYGIELTRHCNFACVMCPHPKYRPDEKGNMSWDLFRQVVDDVAPYAEIIKLHWVGEPLIHPRVLDMIRYAREATKAQLFLSTNGSLLEGDLAEAIRASGLDKIIFSLDGNSAETFEKIRVKGKFAQVVGNITDFLESVQEKGGPLSEIKIIQFRENADEVAGFQERWKGYDHAMVHTMWLSSWAGQLPEMEERSDQLSPYAGEERQPCADLWFKMQVDWTGKVSLCCFDWSGSKILGDLTKQTVREVWQGPWAHAARESHLRQHYAGICAGCKEWAKVQEYEFWYDYSAPEKDASFIWHAEERLGSA